MDLTTTQHEGDAAPLTLLHSLSLSVVARAATACRLAICGRKLATQTLRVWLMHWDVAERVASAILQVTVLQEYDTLKNFEWQK